MPITQERFLDVIDSAAPVIKLVRYLRMISRHDQEIIMNANAAIDHLEDANTRRVVQELLGQVNMINKAIVDSDELISILEIKVGIEQKYFKRVGKSNQRAAHYQRQKRILTQAGHGEVYNILAAEREEDRAARVTNGQGQSQEPSAKPPAKFENDPGYVATQRASHKIWEQTHAQAKPAKAKIASIPAGASYDRGVISTSVPSSEELLKEGLPPEGQDIL